MFYSLNKKHGHSKIPDMFIRDGPACVEEKKIPLILNMFWIFLLVVIYFETEK